MIGIYQGHGARVTPQNPEYSTFFDFLRSHQIRTEPITELTDEALSECNSLLLGELHSPFSSSEINALKRWLDKGGSALVLASMGGDDAPAGMRDSSSNLSCIDACALPARGAGYEGYDLWALSLETSELPTPLFLHQATHRDYSRDHPPTYISQRGLPVSDGLTAAQE